MVLKDESGTIDVEPAQFAHGRLPIRKEEGPILQRPRTTSSWGSTRQIIDPSAPQA
ncbi:hypothetical protein NITHO_5270001 [Nitrolancea hollandica Lb]|uniref:Uncharacterized protein n=1 Tax=Nitrolancea hollandica Lb TaxID=1129897 RepID=I4ELS0_9BACT|nr:hypothetical protein NITHO_5270001 [Nitrolancea hollandica Lb]